MKTAECAHCGKVGLTIDDACLNCSLTIDPGEPANLNAPFETDPPPVRNEHIFEPPTPDFLQSFAPPPDAADDADRSVPTASEANYPPETGRLKYLRVECWKCKIVYNWEKTKICANCGCALRFYKKEEIRSLKGDSVLSSHLARSFLIVVFILAGLVGGFYYVVKSMDAAKTKAAAGITEEQPELPADGWYRSNIWNFYRELPTVDEILAKNARATSKTAPARDIQTLSFKGNVSFADGDCVTDLCAEKLLDAAMREDQSEMSRVNGYQPRVFTKDQFKSKITDDYELPEYQSAGALEAYRKAPDKVLRKMSVGVPRQTRKLETIEVFDGFTGWKKSLVSENRQTLNESVSILAGRDLEALKSSVSALKADYSSKTMKFARLKKVKSSVNFVLENLGFDKTELIYFDAVSGLVTKIESGDNTCYLTAYAEYGDVKLPSTMYFRTIAEDGYVVWTKVENIAWTINEPLDDAVFAKP